VTNATAAAAAMGPFMPIENFVNKITQAIKGQVHAHQGIRVFAMPILSV
jgi:hypothetical protein